MSKTSKKSAKEASNIFHSIMGASVKGNPKPKKKVMNLELKKSQEIYKHMQEEIAMVVPDYGQYLVLSISGKAPYQLFYTMKNSTPVDKYNKIEKAILDNAKLLNLTIIDSLE